MVATDAKFKLKSDFLPAGDQPAAIQNIVSGITSGLQFQTLLGVTGSGKTYTMANIIAELNRPALVMCHNKTLAAQLYSEFKEFFPNNSVEYFVSYYDYYQPEAYVPHKDMFIEKDSSINEHIEQMRLAATKSVIDRSDFIIVATVSAIYGIGEKSTYQEMSLALSLNMSMNRQDLINRLLDMQYQRSELEFKRGTFRLRGDIVDIFPAEHDDLALRVELSNIIINMKLFDGLTGKVIASIEQFTIFPTSHYVVSKVNLVDALKDIEHELSQRIIALESQGKMNEAFRLQQRTNFDLELLREIGFCKGIENYSRHITRRPVNSPPPTLIDYLPKNALLFIDESHATIPQIMAMHAGDKSRKTNLVEYGFRLPSALDNRPLTFKEFELLIPQTVFVSATPGEYELKHQQNIATQIVRPTGILDPQIIVRSATTQIDDLLSEIKIRISLGERVLVTILTKKMAEKLTAYYTECGIKVRYLHADIDTIERIEIVRDLRLGVFDVLIGVNLLREGLDIPEVSLVAILDADKEGFLRSYRSLIQTIGRAARHLNAIAILYGDKITDSMRLAIEETDHRRQVQADFNHQHGIVPYMPIKPVKDIINNTEKKQPTSNIITHNMTDAKIMKSINKLRKQMTTYVKQQNFEAAILCRDQLSMLERALDG